MYYKIGINIGLTNTDAVLVTSENEIIAKTKRTTTADIGTAIEKVIERVISISKVPKSEIKHIMLGTNQYNNALVENEELSKVGVLRLIMSNKIATNIPKKIKNIVGDHVYEINVGYDINEEIISVLCENDIRKHLQQMKGNVDSLAIVGVFSKNLSKTELKVASWAKEVLGTDVTVSCSNNIGALGFVDRESATIVNSALQGLSHKTVTAFKESVKRLNIGAKLFFGKNDGTLMPVNEAQDFPILSILSSYTNNTRGAAELSNTEKAILIDVGGSASSIGVVGNNYDEKKLTHNQIESVLTNFRMPNTIPMEFGGGTIVSFDGNVCNIGPDSVGSAFKKRSLAFAGGTLTISDFFIASGDLEISDTLDTESLKKTIEFVSGKEFSDAFEMVKNQIQLSIDELVGKLNTSKKIPVIACGGGAFLVPEKIKRTSTVIFPKHMEVASAFGACFSKIEAEKEPKIESENHKRNYDSTEVVNSTTLKSEPPKNIIITVIQKPSLNKFVLKAKHFRDLIKYKLKS